MKKRNRRSRKKTKKTLSYKANIILYSFTFLLFLALSLYGLTHSIQFQDQEIIDYKETGELDYKVHLKPNDFYEDEVLDKNLVYVASLVDKIDTTFDYEFNIDKNIDVDFSYNIIGKLQITDEAGENTYLEKKYVLLQNKKASLNDLNNFRLNEKISLDYDEYNKIATGFRATYAVSTKSNFIITLQIIKSSSNKDVYINGSTTVQTITIPLSEKSVNIKLDYNDINNDSTVINKQDIYLKNAAGISASILFILMSLYFLLKVVKTIEKRLKIQSKYDRYINKILKEYDRLIVETQSLVDFNKYELIEINKFEELLDARDNLKSPINYYVVAPHLKSYFYIVSDRVYFYEANAEEIDNKK